MERKLGVLFAASEAAPFLKTGGLGDVAGSLPQALKKAGCEVRVILPKYGAIPEGLQSQMTLAASFTVPLGWRRQFCGIWQMTNKGVLYYFVDNEYYFHRDKPYGFFDDGERFAFFAKAVVEAIQHLPDFSCDVLHCNDWQTALSPVFLREFYRGVPLYDRVKTLLTVHNLKFQGQMSDYVLGDILGLGGIHAAETQLRSDPRSVNFMRGGLCYSDLLSTVSKTYAQEISGPYFGEGLDDIFRRRHEVVHGIMNGIDTEEFSPKSDLAIAKNFSPGNMAGKAACKMALQKELGLHVDPHVPLLLMIGRLTEQKGVDLLQAVFEDIMALPLQLAVLGTGDQKYEDMLRGYEGRYPGRLSAALTFDEPLSHRMYAGGDLLLMPSLYEPCGLAQMIAMGYGTLPVVRETGGLRDSVTPYNQHDKTGTGFSFANYNAHEMLHTIGAAVDLYHQEPDLWAGLVKNAMEADFSWQRAAREYLALYHSLHPQTPPENGQTKQ